MGCHPTTKWGHKTIFRQGGGGGFSLFCWFFFGFFLGLQIQRIKELKIFRMKELYKRPENFQNKKKKFLKLTHLSLTNNILDRSQR